MADTHEAVIERYLEFWNAGTPAEQQRLASETFTDDVCYRAPIGVLTGPYALIGFRDQFAGHMGEVAFRRRDEPGVAEVHHDRARLRWELEAGGKNPFAAGTDVLEFDAEGRIAAVTAFLDQAPEGFDPHAHL